MIKRRIGRLAQVLGAVIAIVVNSGGAIWADWDEDMINESYREIKESTDPGEFIIENVPDHEGNTLEDTYREVGGDPDYGDNSDDSSSDDSSSDESNDPF